MSLLLLRPLSVLMLTYGLLGLTVQKVRDNRFILTMAAAWLSLALLQLIPLPPSIWHTLPGHEIVREIDQRAGLGEIWRPLSMVPYETIDSAWALLTPIATLVLGIRIEESDRRRLLLPIALLGFLSAAVGLLQMMGDPNGSLYFYRFTHNGMPVGLLANRNHQAAFLACVMPIMAAWAASRPAKGEGRRSLGRRSGFLHVGRAWRRWLPPFVGAVIVIPLILATGSRSGIVLGFVALLSLPLIVSTSSLHRDVEGADRRQVYIGWALFAALIALAALTVLLGRAISFNRASSLSAADDARIGALPIVLTLIKAYAPWGTGLGTFEQVYYLEEPDRLLSSVYMNHVHNDWIELVLTGGAPAVVLASLGLIAFARASIRLIIVRHERNASLPVALLGLVVMVIIGLASITDYPLRTPSLACLSVLAVLWATSGPNLLPAKLQARKCLTGLRILG